jgi:phosphoglycolate phosphatase-like HAD superfamily hydrolase
MSGVRSVSLVITDLDNTLFDWVRIWYASFSALLNSLSKLSGIPAATLIPEVKVVHENHGTAEYAFLIEELPSLQAKHPGDDLSALYSPAIEAYRSARGAALRLYPGVLDTLGKLKENGCLLVGYTESMAFYSNYRLRHLGLDLLLDFLYSPPDHDLPRGLTPAQIRRYPAGNYVLRKTQHRHTPSGELKPNPEILQRIIHEVGGLRERAVYVGDSLMKDVAMAQDAGVTDVWAQYGIAQDRPEYELLRRVTHWTEDAVEREKRLTHKDVSPSFVLRESFSELIGIFSFIRFARESIAPAEGR